MNESESEGEEDKSECDRREPFTSSLSLRPNDPSLHSFFHSLACSCIIIIIICSRSSRW